MTGASYFSRPRPRLFGHRGAAGLAPENTLPSFERAVADGAGYLELDVHATRDGVVVVIHDPTLERTTDGVGPVNAQRYPELCRYDAGFRFSAGGSEPYRGRGIRVPALEEVLDALEEDHTFLLEGGVFTPDVIETWLEYKRTRELDQVRLRPHPWEFWLYYDV